MKTRGKIQTNGHYITGMFRWYLFNLILPHITQLRILIRGIYNEAKNSKGNSNWVRVRDYFKFSRKLSVSLLFSIVKKLSVESTLEITLEQGLIGTIIALGALLNFIVFFVFLKKKQYYRARGVILATFLAAIIVLISKFY